MSLELRITKISEIIGTEFVGAIYLFVIALGDLLPYVTPYFAAVVL